MSAETIFPNERLTFRLDLIANTAIALNDGVFVKETGLAIREIRVLRLIDDNPGIVFVDIARLTGLEKSQTSRIIQRLVRDGLARRENSRKDARRFRLFTTPTGEALRQRARLLSDRLEAILTRPATDQTPED